MKHLNPVLIPTMRLPNLLTKRVDFLGLKDTVSSVFNGYQQPTKEG